jgi:hypothetical protein
MPPCLLPCTQKKRAEREIFRALERVACPSLLIHDETKLDPFQSYAGAPTELCESGVHDGGGACDMPCARGPCVPHTGGGIHGLLHGVLRAGIRYVVALIPLLTVAALSPGAAQSDPFGDPTHCGLRDPM